MPITSTRISFHKKQLGRCQARRVTLSVQFNNSRIQCLVNQAGGIHQVRPAANDVYSPGELVVEPLQLLRLHERDAAGHEDDQAVRFGAERAGAIARSGPARRLREIPRPFPLQQVRDRRISHGFVALDGLVLRALLQHAPQNTADPRLGGLRSAPLTLPAPHRHSDPSRLARPSVGLDALVDLEALRRNSHEGEALQRQLALERCLRHRLRSTLVPPEDVSDLLGTLRLLLHLLCDALGEALVAELVPESAVVAAGGAQGKEQLLDALVSQLCRREEPLAGRDIVEVLVVGDGHQRQKANAKDQLRAAYELAFDGRRDLLRREFTPLLIDARRQELLRLRETRRHPVVHSAEVLVLPHREEVPLRDAIEDGRQDRLELPHLGLLLGVLAEVENLLPSDVRRGAVLAQFDARRVILRQLPQADLRHRHRIFDVLVPVLSPDRVLHGQGKLNGLVAPLEHEDPVGNFRSHGVVHQAAKREVVKEGGHDVLQAAHDEQGGAAAGVHLPVEEPRWVVPNELLQLISQQVRDGGRRRTALRVPDVRKLVQAEAELRQRLGNPREQLVGAAGQQRPQRVRHVEAELVGPHDLEATAQVGHEEGVHQQRLRVRARLRDPGAPGSHHGDAVALRANDELLPQTRGLRKHLRGGLRVLRLGHEEQVHAAAFVDGIPPPQIPHPLVLVREVGAKALDGRQQLRRRGRLLQVARSAERVPRRRPERPRTVELGFHPAAVRLVVLGVDVVGADEVDHVQPLDGLPGLLQGLHRDDAHVNQLRGARNARQGSHPRPVHDHDRVPRARLPHDAPQRVLQLHPHDLRETSARAFPRRARVVVGQGVGLEHEAIRDVRVLLILLVVVPGDGAFRRLGRRRRSDAARHAEVRALQLRHDVPGHGLRDAGNGAADGLKPASPHLLRRRAQVNRFGILLGKHLERRPAGLLPDRRQRGRRSAQPRLHLEPLDALVAVVVRIHLHGNLRFREHETVGEGLGERHLETRQEQAVGQQHEVPRDPELGQVAQLLQRALAELGTVHHGAPDAFELRRLRPFLSAKAPAEQRPFVARSEIFLHAVSACDCARGTSTRQALGRNRAHNEEGLWWCRSVDCRHRASDYGRLRGDEETKV
eukprot:scaffold7328_cov314-Pinguiococcus_pyrenoidosus.AAC.22